MRATIVLVLLLIIITGTVACGGANNRRYTVAVTTTASLAPNEPLPRLIPSDTGTNITRPEYRVEIDARIKGDIVLIQLVTNGSNSDRVVEQLVSPNENKHEYWLALMPAMHNIVFYVKVDNTRLTNPDMLKIYDGDREVVRAVSSFRITTRGQVFVIQEDSRLRLVAN